MFVTVAAAACAPRGAAARWLLLRRLRSRQGRQHLPARRREQTASSIVLNQFKRTRAADPWFYANGANPYLAFSPAEWKRINETVAESIEASYGIRRIRDAFEVTRFDRR
jgi:hypothetical protein